MGIINEFFVTAIAFYLDKELDRVSENMLVSSLGGEEKWKRWCNEWFTRKKEIGNLSILFDVEYRLDHIKHLCLQHKHTSSLPGPEPNLALHIQHMENWAPNWGWKLFVLQSKSSLSGGHNRFMVVSIRKWFSFALGSSTNAKHVVVISTNLRL